MRRLIPAISLVLTVPLAMAQDVGGLERLDQRGGEPGPMIVTPRDARIDLRQPIGFRDLFRMPGAARGTDLFARIDGGLVAVFSWPSQGPSVPGEVPPGTIFHIGLPPSLASRPPTPVISAPNRLDRSVDTENPVKFPVAGARTIWNDDTLRASRIAQLLRRAAGQRAEDPPRQQ